MNIVLWILQSLLAVHTLMGSVWKFTNPEQSVSSLRTLPHGVWLGLSVIEIFLAVGLVIPALHRPLAMLAPIAALCIAAEMLFYSVWHLQSGETNHSPVVYWLVVAAVCGFIAFGRLKLKPL